MMIDDVKYIRADSVKKGQPAEKMDGLEYAIVRSRNHGVLAGYVHSVAGQTVKLLNSRRIYYFKGANVLEELAVYGTKQIDQCKIAPVVELPVVMLEACGIIYCTEVARECLEGAKEWKQ
jgi:hypothetical protein